MSVAGVSRQTWDTTGAGITGDFAVSGNYTVGGTFTVTGATTFTGQLLAAAGTALLPSYSFTADPNTGMYSIGADDLGFATGGLQRVHIDINGTLRVNAAVGTGVPTTVFFSNVDGFATDLVGNAAVNASTIRMLNNAYSQVLLQVATSNTANVIGGNTALALGLFTNATKRVDIAATGGVTFVTPTSGGHVINGTTTINGTTQVNGILGASSDFVSGANAYALNYYINPGTASAAGTFGIPSGLGSAMVTWGLSTANTGNIDFTSGGAYMLKLVRLASAVNYVQMTQAITGTGPNLSVEGGDANIQFNHFSKGNGVHAFFTGGGAQFVVSHVAGATNYLAVAGSAGGNPTIAPSGGLGIRFPASAIQVIGAGRPWSGSVTESQSYLYNVALGVCNFTASANNRCHEWYKDATALYGLWISDNAGAATEWLRATGGQGSGTVSVIVTSPLITLTTTTGGVQITGTATSNGSLVLNDTGAAGANFKMHGNNGAQSKPDKYLRACADDFQVLNHTYNLALLTVSEVSATAGVGAPITDYRGLMIARDPGAAPGSGIPVGGIVMASVTAGVIVNALGTIVANGTTNLMTVLTAGAGTNTTINAGTWRNLGCISAGGNICLYIRTA
jgi:hypothetical protein